MKKSLYLKCSWLIEVILSFNTGMCLYLGTLHNNYILVINGIASLIICLTHFYYVGKLRTKLITYIAIKNTGKTTNE